MADGMQTRYRAHEESITSLTQELREQADRLSSLEHLPQKCDEMQQSISELRSEIRQVLSRFDRQVSTSPSPNPPLLPTPAPLITASSSHFRLPSTEISLHPPTLPKPTIASVTSTKPPISQSLNEILPSLNQIEHPRLSAIFPIHHAPPRTPTLTKRQPASSATLLVSPPSPLRDKNCWCALDSKKLILGAEPSTAWRHRLNDGPRFANYKYGSSAQPCGSCPCLASVCGCVSLVEYVAFDSSEVLVFAGATSGAIKLWDLQEFYPFGEFFVSGSAHKDHDFGVNSIKFIPNGRWVVSGGLDNVGGLDNDNVVSSLLRKFAFNDLKLATRSFRPESLLGEGGFGCVFKGWIEENGTAPARPGTGLTVAVKTLNHDGLQGHKEWLAEVNYLGELVHPNLVTLIGHCIADDQRVLVYEFMPRGSLENHLFRRSLPLPWSTRMKIALGAAMGLAFLHEEAEGPVTYRDFKTSNILLDAVYDAKLSDSGLAKDGPEGDKTHVSTRVMGTYGYAAPEYVMTGHLTSRSEVYIFSVVLVESRGNEWSFDKCKRQWDPGKYCVALDPDALEFYPCV